MRVVILGGTGNFGVRVLRALRHEPGMEVLVAGRRRSLPPGLGDVRVVPLDLGKSYFPQVLRDLSPGLIINCTGPFQKQGYDVARATLAAGSHYIDLADGRAFVSGFSRELQATASRLARTAITGASTLPALSSAVVTELASGMAQLRSIETVIAPGQRAPRGRATLEAVFSYLGEAFQVWQEGQWRPVHGWMDLRRVRLDIGPRLAAACDVPDLTLFPEHFRGVQTVTFHAALEVGLQHLALWSLAALRTTGARLPVARWAVTLSRVAGLFDLISGNQGGMSVKVTGTTQDGRALSRTWQLVAPALNGPEIPTMPAILLARLLARGQTLKSGAYPCMGVLRLADFDPEFRKWGIVTRIAEEPL